MPAGRKPLPTSLKKKKGTAQNTRLLKDEYAPKVLDKLPPPPAFLNSHAKKEYKKVGAILFKDGLIANTDLAIFIGYCAEMGNYIDAQEVLNDEGKTVTTQSGYMQPHPMVAIANTALKNALAIGANFGITPSARTKISGPKKESKNPIGKLIALNGKGNKTG